MATHGPQFNDAEIPQRDPFEDLKRKQQELLRQFKLAQKAEKLEMKQSQSKGSAYHDKHTKGRTPFKNRY